MQGEDDVRGYFPNPLSRDFLQMFAGDLLGYGIARHVYEHRQDPSLVIKIEVTSQSFQNVAEWDVWDKVKEHQPTARWLAPCIDISPCGIILLQRRTTPAPEGKLPKRMPQWLSDFKAANYGMLDDRFVCHDYGTTVHWAYVSNKLKKADWW